MAAQLTPEMMLRAYAMGIFPMAPSAASKKLQWYAPEIRATFPLDGRFHVPKSLQKFIHKTPYEIRLNTAFEAVIKACATTRPETWINATIISTFCSLHQQGAAHSVEAWENGHLVGGLYGAQIGGAFFGESMFSLKSNASKQCLVHLVAHLIQRDFKLLDIQFYNDHLAQFGVEEVPRAHYEAALKHAIALPRHFIG